MAKTDRRARKPAVPRLPYDVKLALEAAGEKKAVDIIVLDLKKSSAFTDFFVICTGGNIRQVQAIADGIQETLAQKGLKPALTEGYERGQWVLIDYFDFIVHIFSPATREYLRARAAVGRREEDRDRVGGLSSRPEASDASRDAGPTPQTLFRKNIITDVNTVPSISTSMCGVSYRLSRKFTGRPA